MIIFMVAFFFFLLISPIWAKCTCTASVVRLCMQSRWCVFFSLLFDITSHPSGRTTHSPSTGEPFLSNYNGSALSLSLALTFGIGLLLDDNIVRHESNQNTAVYFIEIEKKSEKNEWRRRHLIQLSNAWIDSDSNRIDSVAAAAATIIVIVVVSEVWTIQFSWPDKSRRWEK